MSISLFVSDIDGCLAEPYKPYDLEALGKMAQMVKNAEDGAGPRVAICSGRPYSYVEAMSQVLGVQHPVLFEAGGGCFDPVTTGTTWNPAFTETIEEGMLEIRKWMASEIVPLGQFKVDYDKRTQAGFLSPNADEILKVLPRVKEFVREIDDSLNVFHTDVSIDVVAEGITKRESLLWLAEMCDTDVSEMAYIGDTNGDLGALSIVGASYAPANATDAVRNQVDFVMERRVIHGVLDAYVHAREMIAEPSGVSRGASG